ncbi:MAG: DNA topoisomerase subunit B [Patescibacteria group bacterium]
MATKQTSDYGAQQIQVLEGLEPVRKRPGMYIGSTDVYGLHETLREIIDNSVDEALAGHAKNVWIQLNKDGTAAVSDDGRGIPTGMHSVHKKSALELVMTQLHAGGKFGGDAYKISGGLHGVGASVVNALSDWVVAEVRRDGKVYRQRYERGIPKTPVEAVMETIQDNPQVVGLKKGTSTTFYPDASIFKEFIKTSEPDEEGKGGGEITYSWDYDFIRKIIRERAYLVPKLFFHFIDKRKAQIKEVNYYFEGGIVSLVEKLNENKDPIIKPIYINKSDGDVQVEIAVQYNNTYTENVESYVNVINTVNGGTHLTGFRMALTRAINDYAKKIKAFKSEDDSIIGDDTREGLTAVVFIKMPQDNIQFEGQTKGKLGNSEIQSVVNSIVKEALNLHFEENPSEGKRILEKVYLAAKARLAAKAAKEAVIRKGALEGSTLPGKLADCQSKNPAESELFIVEGDSAGGSVKQGRDRKFQAILPLFGKILNTERARIDQIVGSEKFKDLIIAIGAGIAEQFNIEKLRYHRIIIMADADVDGSHITCLYLTFLYRHLRQVVEGGHVYVAMPPLFKIQRGKEVRYAFNESERAKAIKELTKGNASINIQRYKGLGEMNAEELWETTLNPANRLLKQITIDDAEEADEVFTMLMGDSVPPRKHFIQTNAITAELDI